VENENDRVLSVEWLPISELTPNPNNPRQHTARQIRQIASSIESFGFNVPILVDNQNRIVAGHGRARAAQRLGQAKVPIIRLARLTEMQVRAFGVADNRLTENSTWNDRLLGKIFSDLAALELDFSLEVTGFSMAEIDLRIEELSSSDQDKIDSADQIPQSSVHPPVSKPGDLWILGKHRIICGNALDAHDFDALMQGERAAMAFTDPPYNVPIDGHATGLGAIRHREFAMATGEMTNGEHRAFLTVACGLHASHSHNGAIHFICMDWRHADTLQAAGNASYSELKNICVWVKHNAGMGSFYRSQHELVFVFKVGRGSHRNNFQLGQFGRHRSNVWHYPGAANFGRANDEGLLPAD
jgi:hypothetical protein